MSEMETSWTFCFIRLRLKLEITIHLLQDAISERILIMENEERSRRHVQPILIRIEQHEVDSLLPNRQRIRNSCDDCPSVDFHRDCQRYHLLPAMNDPLSKPQLLEILKSRRAEWDALLASVDEARMDIPGAAGDWSVKDIVSHITAYERWLVEWLTAASQNTFPAPSPLDDADVERRNARVYETTHALPLQQVMGDAQNNFEALINIIETL